MLPFKVDDDEDDIAISIEKLKMQVSALLGDEDCKDILDADPLLMKDKSTCSTSELEMIRRERNRMHAKKTRLRKKKMIQEMETVSQTSSFKFDVLERLLLPYIPLSTHADNCVTRERDHGHAGGTYFILPQPAGIRDGHFCTN